ncbi:MAG: M20/M25/M40 family metallo-hydrolase [Synergistaceae bacterium]|nr:M20/M25/M40 family metallo-hydrolase [Synergistaceae bacterium]
MSGLNVDLSGRIGDILLKYVGARSVSGSAGEKDAEKVFLDCVSAFPYFRRHRELYGAYAIAGDALGRAVSLALLRGKGDDTVVLIHHNDVVGVEDFHTLKELAFSPDELEGRLLAIKDSLAPEAKADLESGGYLFGRGVCDMKGGGAIQLALLESYSRLENFRGNVIVLGLPDEENLSAGMRAGVCLLSDLQDKYGLKYRLMINSEPHQRKMPQAGLFSTGSIGKMMPFVYVRGCLAHAGKVYEGFNPLGVLSRVVCACEADFAFSDVCGTEASPPPTWLYMKDSKNHYDVSMPLSAYGCFSVHTMKQQPADVLRRLNTIARGASDDAVAGVNDSYRAMCAATGRKFSALPWRTRVVGIGELVDELRADLGDSFAPRYGEKIAELQELFSRGGTSMAELNRMLLEWIFDNLTDLSPCLVYGLVPPYYPHVANVNFPGIDAEIKSLQETLDGFTRAEFAQTYEAENYYTGISDLSYSSIFNAKAVGDTLAENMTFWKTIYDLPLGAIEKVSMPCINIGPWGKDFHKMTERVLKEDLFERTPKIIDRAIGIVLKR